MAEIVLSRDGKELSRLPLGPGEVLIGRDAQSGLSIDDSRVSRSHARIRRGEGGFVIEDCGSTHGLLLADGSKIKTKTLANGDRFNLGKHQLTFLSRDGATLDFPAPENPWETLHTVIKTGADDSGAKRLQALFEISRILEARNFSGTLSLIMDKAISIMGADRGFLILADAKTRALKVQVARDASGDIAELEMEKISRSVVEKVMAEGKPILLENALTAEWGTESVVAQSIHSVLCAPLTTAGAVSGVIYVDDRKRQRAFSQQDLAFFTAFAQQAKAAIDGSLAYWEIVEGLFTASNDFIVLYDPDGHVTRANHTALALSGLSEEMMKGKRLGDLFSEEEASALLRESVVSDRELSLRGGAKEVPLSVSTFALRDRHGKTIGVCLIGRDLSHIKSLIAQLTAANQKLRELNDMKSEFVGMVSHELKNPLTVMQGYIDLLSHDQEAPLRGKQAQFLERTAKKIAQISSLIGDLLNLTRIETGKVSLRPRAIDLKALIDEAVEEQARAAGEKKVAVSVSIADKLPAIEADEDMLRRLIVNFVSNGIKYNREGGTLEVFAEGRPDGYRLRFTDSGIGLAPKDLARLFGRFFRADAVRDLPGTGLGLSIVKAIIERHGGVVSATSELGRGTKFVIDLPCRPPNDV